MEKANKLENRNQRKLTDLDQRTIELEKMEIARLRAEQKLISTEESYRKFFEESKDLVVLVQGMLIKFISPSLAKLLGYIPDEVLNAPFEYFVPQDELPRLVEYYLGRMAGKDVPAIYQMMLMHRNGKDVYVEIAARMVNYQGRRADLVFIKELGEGGRED